MESNGVVEVNGDEEEDFCREENMGFDGSVDVEGAVNEETRGEETEVVRRGVDDKVRGEDEDDDDDERWAG